LKRLYIDLGAALAVALVLCMLSSGQNNQGPSRTATVMGTVTDVNGDALPGATVVLREIVGDDPRTIVTTENGLFEFQDVKPGTSYHVSVAAQGLAEWKSSSITLEPGQFKIVTKSNSRFDPRSLMSRLRMTRCRSRLSN